jgi:predicted metal-dependent hydrolase
MKTKLGTGNIEARRIWLNLELAIKPVQSMEYILMQELTYLLERHHNERVTGLLDQHLPQWRTLREYLNGSLRPDF